MRDLLKKIRPWQWILGLVGFGTILCGLVIGEGFPLDEEVPGLTKSVLTAPDVPKAHVAMGKLEEACRATVHILEDDGPPAGKKRYKTAVQASVCRAKQCRATLVGSGMCRDGDMESAANCCTAYLREKLGTDDYQLDVEHPDHPGKTGRELWIEYLTKLADAAEKLK